MLSQPFDYFDEAALFYRSLLGLEPHASQDIAGPDGLLRSRAVSDPTGRVRLALTVPRLAGEEHGRLAELQHVAFAPATRGAAARCASAACRCCRSPATTTTTSPPARARRRLGRDAARARRPARRRRGRRALHFFTEMVGDRLFFEVVERRGSYDGYGAANSAIRLSAQHREREEEDPMSTREAWTNSPAAARDGAGADRGDGARAAGARRGCAG